MEYDPRFYGLFFHDDTQLPTDVSMWDHLDEVSQGYQDSLVMHMVYKPVQVSLQKEEERYAFQGKSLKYLGSSMKRNEPSSLLYYRMHTHTHTHTHTLIVLPQSVWTSVGLVKCSETCFAEDMVFDISLTMAFSMKVLCPKSVDFPPK